MAIRKLEIAETEQERIDRLEEYNEGLGEKLKDLDPDSDEAKELKEKIKENNDKMSAEKKDKDNKAETAASDEKKGFVKVYDTVYPGLLALQNKDMIKVMTNAQKKNPDAEILGKFKRLAKMAQEMEDLCDDILEELDDAK